MTEEVARCDARVDVKGVLRDRLMQVDGPHEIEDSFPCELPLGHEALHHALGQGAAEGEEGSEWWIRWGDDIPPEVVQLADCDSTIDDADGDPEAVCLFFAGHEGPHSSGDATWT